MTRLTAAFWVQAYLRRLTLENIPAYILAHGDDTAGAVLVKLATLDGEACLFQLLPDTIASLQIKPALKQAGLAV